MNNKDKELKKIGKSLSAKHLAFAKNILKNKSQEQSYIDAGYAKKAAINAASRLLTNVNIQKYISLAKEIATEKAQDELNFSEKEWLEYQRRILRMSCGDVELQKVVTDESGIQEVQVKETNLAAANKAMELIARRMGWLTDNKKIQTEPVSFHIDLG